MTVHHSTNLHNKTVHNNKPTHQSGTPLNKPTQQDATQQQTRTHHDARTRMLLAIVKGPDVGYHGRLLAKRDGLGAQLAQHPWLVLLQQRLQCGRHRVWIKGKKAASTLSI